MIIANAILLGNNRSGGNNFGLLTQLKNQTGNDGTLKGRITYSGIVAGGIYKGTHNPATSYNEGDRVALTADAYFWFQAKRNLTGGAHLAPNPLADNADWEQLYGMELLQDMGSGQYIRYTLGFNQDDQIRWGTIQRGTLSTAQRTIKEDTIDTGVAIGASASGVVVSAVPQSLSYTIPTGLTNVWDKVSVGSSSSSMTILGAAASPSFVNVTLATGQDLEAGDAIKLENSSTNFNIARVITYNSSTGAAYLAIINGVGSGTYTSWTVYKCALVFATWDGGPTFVYVHGLVDTYNSGTGAITITTFVQLGSSGTTRTNWTFREGRSAPVITSSAGTSVSQDGGHLGVMIRGSYKGTDIIHRTDIRNNGTAWRYIILEGPNAGDEFDIDTYNSTFVANQQLTVATELAAGPSSGYAFIAFSIASASGTNTHAGIRHSTNLANPQSYLYRATVDVFTSNIPIAGGGDSSGEAAYNFKKDGTADTNYWWPDHNFDRVAFLGSRTYKVNGSTINPETDKTYAYRFQDITSLELDQTLEIFHPDEVAKMADLTSQHILDSNGLYYKLTLTPSQDWLIATGYEHMIAFPENAGNLWFNSFKTDTDETFTWPGGTTPQNLTADQIGWRSCLFFGVSTDYASGADYALALWTASNFWRIGDTGKGQDTVGYSAGPKLYPRPYDAFVLDAQRVIEGRLFTGLKGTLTP